MSDDVYDKLSEVQKVLVVPKKRFNKFGNFYYRNCEDIVEAVKKVMPAGCSIRMSDESKVTGDWHYIKATAYFGYKGTYVSADGEAREPLDKKGMDSAQISGSCSSYARKYALNGLFAIDDNKDPDEEEKGETHHAGDKISNDRALRLSEQVTKIGADRQKLFDKYGVKTFNDLTVEMADHLERGLEKAINQVKGAEYARV